MIRPVEIGAHAFVILGNTPDGDYLLAAAWTTLDEECPDDECVLHREDHEEIRHASAVAFSRARLWEAAKLDKAIDARSFRVAEPLPDSVFRRVIECAAASRLLRREFKSYLPKP